MLRVSSSTCPPKRNARRSEHHFLCAIAASLFLASQLAVRADNTAQTLPFTHAWTDAAQISVANDWSGVPGIVGYRGDDLTTATGTDPQTILADGSGTPTNVLANQTNPNTNTTGAVAEFDTIADPTIALQGSGTADAPFILISVDTTGLTHINVAYSLRDIDGSADDAVQPVALQFRVGSTGNFTNVPSAFVADATSGPSLATLVTPVSVELPSLADGQLLVQLRIMTANAVGSDEWVGIDDINITGTPGTPATTDPSASGTANPNPVAAGAETILSVAVTPGANPLSTGIAVSADLSSIGASAAQPFFDDGVAPDVAAGDNVFSWRATVSALTTPGAKTIAVTITDAQGRSASASIGLTTVAAPPPVPTGQTLPFFQDWTNISLITVNDNWSGVPGIVGYRGDDLTTATGTDPQTILVDGSATPVNVIANQTNPSSLATGGVAEFHLTNATIALNGSGTADAPHIVISVDTIGHSSVAVSYNVSDLDGSADNAAQAVALQYRVGASGNYTNLPAGFVADATDAGAATRVTPVFVTLPTAANDQPLVQLRILTTNAVGNDEWVGIDDILVTDQTAVTQPTGLGAANPSTVATGQSTLLTVTVTPGSNPPSTGLSVTMDLSAIGQSSTQTLFDDATNGDVTAGDNVFSFAALVSGTAGSKTLPGTVADLEQRSTTFNIALSVTAPPTITSIAAIQGPGTSSPFAGQTVTTTGIVTARKFNGFFIQTPDADADADSNTSEGVFVFTSSAPPPAAAVGNRVRVTGSVQEFVPNADPFQPPLTEITAPAVTILSTGEPIPAPIVLTAADTTPTGSLEQLERFEGMRVQVSSLTVVAPTNGTPSEANATSTSDGVFYGVVAGVARPFREPGVQVPDPLPAGAPPTVTRFDGNPEKLRIDSDALIGAPRVDVAAGEVIGTIVGPLDFGFRTYTILPEPETPLVVDTTRLPAPVSVPAAHQFTVASFNMERFFDTVNDPGVDDVALTAAAFNNRLNKASLLFRNILRSPDIVGVEEVENLSTLQALATRLNAHAVINGQPDPLYVAYLEEGNDIGGIDVGFLVKSSRVTVVDVTQIGKDATYIDPNTGQPALLNDRPSLVLRAVPQSSTGATFPITVIVNHLRSLNGVEDLVDGRVRVKRRAQAEFLANFIQERQVMNPGERILSIGDYNAFEFSDGYVDSIGTIRGTPTPASEVVLASADLVNPDLVDLVATVPPDQRYSYVFDGSAQSLDHAIVTSNLIGRVALEFGRVDADFPETARNDPNSPARLSDHDPLVVFVSFPDPAPTQTAVATSLNPSAFGQTITLTATVTSGGNAVPDGTVTFKEGATVLDGPLALNGLGQASFTTSALPAGSHTIVAEYSGTGNFTASTGSVTQVVNAGLSISDVTVSEGNGGTTTATFTVTLTPAMSDPVTVKFATANGTATSPVDYVGRPLTTLTFAPGVTARTIAVAVKGDVLSEGAETFFVNLSAPTNSSIVDGQGAGTIVDNDPVPAIVIGNVTRKEGNSGTVDFTFLVKMNRVAGRTVTVDFATAGGTATSGDDFTGASGILQIPPGTRTMAVVVAVKGDRMVEGNETFFVNLTNAVGATVADGQGRATIVNDDRTPRIAAFLPRSGEAGTQGTRPEVPVQPGWSTRRLQFGRRRSKRVRARGLP